MVLDVRPVKLRESLYLLIPVDIARLVGVVADSRFALTLIESDGAIKLVYELRMGGEDPTMGKKPLEAQVAKLE